MTKLSRFSIIILLVLAEAVIFPEYFNMVFEQRVVPPQIRFSSVEQKYLIGNYNNNKFTWKDEAGNSYTRDEADHLLPIVNYRVLLYKNQMPDSVRGVKMDIDSLRLNNLYMRVRPRDINMPGVQLFPLLEAKPDRFKLLMPTSFVRINRRLEFIDCKTNKVIESESELFTQALKEQGFNFPATNFFGNPTTRKAFDEGYFVVDAQGKLYHLKKIHGQPYCRAIPLPAGVSIKHMVVYENHLREFYGMIVAENNDVFLLLYDQYKLQKLPSDNYDANQDQLMFIGNIFNRQLIISKDRKSIAYVVDRDYKKIASYQTEIADDLSATFREIYDHLFPFSLAISSEKTLLKKYFFSAYSTACIFINIFLMFVLFYLKKSRRTFSNTRWPDFIFVLLTGIYGFIAVLLFENVD